MPLSNVKIIQMINSIIPLSAFTDNYIWLIVRGNAAIVVDPGDSKPVEKFIIDNNLSLAAILITHHHFDHIGGNEALKKKYDSKILAFKNDENRIPGIDKGLEENQEFKIGNLIFTTIFIPGHTKGHIAFYLKKEKEAKMKFFN